MMHYAGIERSQRLLLTLRALQDAGGVGCTTRKLANATGSMAPGTDVSELRCNGYDIECKYQHVTASGRKIYRYQLKGRKEKIA